MIFFFSLSRDKFGVLFARSKFGTLNRFEKKSYLDEYFFFLNIGIRQKYRIIKKQIYIFFKTTRFLLIHYRPNLRKYGPALNIMGLVMNDR